MELNKEQIKQLLPHREPILLIDQVTECQPGKFATALLHTHQSSFFFDGHFPGKPLMPGVMQLEALAQTGAVAVLSLPEMKGKLALFGGAEKVRFRKQIEPGEVVRLHTEITLLTTRGGKGWGMASVDGKKCCEGEIMFVFGAG